MIINFKKIKLLNLTAMISKKISEIISTEWEDRKWTARRMFRRFNEKSFERKKFQRDAKGKWSASFVSQ